MNRESLQRMTVKELKSMLRERGMKVGGNKSELIDRLLGQPSSSVVMSPPITVGKYTFSVPISGVSPIVQPDSSQPASSYTARTYKARAETIADVQNVEAYMNRLYPGQWSTISVEQATLDLNGRSVAIPDVDWTFTSRLDYSTLTDVLVDSGISDIHVLVESLKPIEQYDGERNNPYAFQPTVVAM